MSERAAAPAEGPDPWSALRPAEVANREREYSPSSCIGGDYRPFVAAYGSRSEAARAESTALGGRWQRISCAAAGRRPALELCLPPAATTSAPVPLLLFVHGGYWQELSAADSLFAATACIARGRAFAAVDYTLAPQARVGDIVRECRQALAWLVAHGPALGIDAAAIVLAGSSAGAHLAAMMGHQAPVPPRASLLISGVYWLEPLLGTSISQALALDAAEARALSPGTLPLEDSPPALVCWGAIETAAFKAQSHRYAADLRAAGIAAEAVELPGRNHFDVVLDLADPATPLGQSLERAFTDPGFPRPPPGVAG